MYRACPSRGMPWSISAMIGPISAARSSSSNRSTAFFSGEWGRLKNGTQMHVSMRTILIGLSRLDLGPILFHRNSTGKILESHPTRVSAILFQRGAHGSLGVVHLSEIAEVFNLLVSELNSRSHLKEVYPIACRVSIRWKNRLWYEASRSCRMIPSGRTAAAALTSASPERYRNQYGIRDRSIVPCAVKQPRREIRIV